MKNQINNLESTVYKLKGFWNAIINRFKYMIFDEKNGERNNNSYSKVAEDLYVNGVINDYEKELIQDVSKKVKYKDDIEDIDDKYKKKKKNKNNYNFS